MPEVARAEVICAAYDAALEECLDAAFYANSEPGRWRNVDKSSLFCATFAEGLHRLWMQHVHREANLLQCIGFKDKASGTQREAGEYLVDIALSRDISFHPPALVPLIEVAAEVESQTSSNAFYRDFSKLLNIQAGTKFFLGGVAHRTEAGMRIYMRRRLDEIQRYLVSAQDQSDWFIGFWPSPKDVRQRGGGSRCNWENLPTYQQRPGLFRYCKQAGAFVEIPNGRLAAGAEP